MREINHALASTRLLREAQIVPVKTVGCVTIINDTNMGIIRRRMLRHAIRELTIELNATPDEIAKCAADVAAGHDEPPPPIETLGDNVNKHAVQRCKSCAKHYVRINAQMLCQTCANVKRCKGCNCIVSYKATWCRPCAHARQKMNRNLHV